MDDELLGAIVVNANGEVLGQATQWFAEVREENLALKNEMGRWVSKYRRAVREHHNDVENHVRWPEAKEVLEYWRDRLSPGAKELRGDRGWNVVNRLMAGHDVATLKQVVDGYAYVPYVVNRKRAPNGTSPQKQIDAALLFSDEKHVQLGLSFFEHGQRLEAASVDIPTEHFPAPGILSEIGEKAVRCAEAGWHVFPVVPTTKRPATIHGLLDATTDVERIRSWWTKHPDSSLGIRCGAESGLVVVDLDVKTGGGSSLGELLLDGREWPDTLTIRTPSGGRHFYWTHPGSEIRNSASLLGPGLDVRGDGGYVVAPPSPGYTTEKRIKPAPLPEWLRKELFARKVRDDTQLAAGQYEKFMLGVTEGGRNDKLLAVGGHLCAKGLPYAEVRMHLVALNRTFCKPPLDDREVAKIVESMTRMDARKAS